MMAIMQQQQQLTLNGPFHSYFGFLSLGPRFLFPFLVLGRAPSQGIVILNPFLHFGRIILKNSDS